MDDPPAGYLERWPCAMKTCSCEPTFTGIRLNYLLIDSSSTNGNQFQNSTEVNL
jgi:hypothetical protein